MRRNGIVVTLENGNFTTLPIDISNSAPYGSLLVIVLHPSEPESRVQVAIRGTGLSVDAVRTLGNSFDLLCVSLPATADPNIITAKVKVTSGLVKISVHVLDEGDAPTIDVPVEMLGLSDYDELHVVNRGLKSVIASMLEGPELFRKSPLYAKIYICGFGSYNHGNPDDPDDPPYPECSSDNQGCHLINIVICGKKKDKHPVDDEVVINRLSEEESAVVGYLQLIVDGGILSAKDEVATIVEFNELARMVRYAAERIGVSNVGL